MKYNLGSGHSDFLFRRHEDTGVSNKVRFLFFHCGCVGELFSILFRLSTVKGKSTSPPFQEAK